MSGTLSPSASRFKQRKRFRGKGTGKGHSSGKGKDAYLAGDVEGPEWDGMDEAPSTQETEEPVAEKEGGPGA